MKRWLVFGGLLLIALATGAASTFQLTVTHVVTTSGHISGITVSPNSFTVPGNFSGSLSVTCDVTCPGTPTFALYTAPSGTCSSNNNASFTLSGSTLSSTSITSAGTYYPCIQVTVATATNSGFYNFVSVTATTGGPSVQISNLTVSPSAVTQGNVFSGTLSTACAPSSCPGTASYAFSSVSPCYTASNNNSLFTLSGTNNATLSSAASMNTVGTFYACITVSMSGVTNSPKDFPVGVTVGSSTPMPSIAVNGTSTGTTVNPGQAVTVSVANGPGNPLDWVGLCTSNTSCGVTPGDYSDYAFIDNGTCSQAHPTVGESTGSCSLTAFTAAGNYYADFFANNTSTNPLATAPFTVAGGGGGGNRFVGTRQYLPVAWNTSYSPVFQSWTARRYHWSRGAITSLQLGFPNWRSYLNPESDQEFDNNVPVTVTASIEYPVGTFTQVKWSGSSSTSVAPGATGWSDNVSVSIPDNTQFFVRIYMSSSGQLPVVYSNQDVANGDLNQVGSDLTMGGTITNWSLGGTVAPYFLIGPTSSPAVAILGDSRTYQGSGGENGDPGHMDGGEVARTIGAHFSYLNMAMSGEAASTFINSPSTAHRRSMLQYASDVVVAYGINDVNAYGESAATTENYLTQVYHLPEMSGKLIFQDTIYPTSSSTDGWTTVANQTTINPANTSRNAVNSWIRANTAGITGFNEVSLAIEASPSGSGLFIAPPAVTNDGLHANVTGTTDIANYGGFPISLYGGGVVGGGGCLTGSICPPGGTWTNIFDDEFNGSGAPSPITTGSLTGTSAQGIDWTKWTLSNYEGSKDNAYNFAVTVPPGQTVALIHCSNTVWEAGGYLHIITSGTVGVNQQTVANPSLGCNIIHGTPWQGSAMYFEELVNDDNNQSPAGWSSKGWLCCANDNVFGGATWEVDVMEVNSGGNPQGTYGGEVFYNGYASTTQIIGVQPLPAGWHRTGILMSRTSGTTLYVDGNNMNGANPWGCSASTPCTFGGSNYFFSNSLQNSSTAAPSTVGTLVDWARIYYQ